MKYTDEQALAINLRDADIMVSAGAGAGKTRVLVDRMTDRILDTREPLSVDAILMMTFTEAAASEMKERIEKSLREQLEKDPANKDILRRIRKIRYAQISTIHSFCSRLIRSRYHEIGLDPSFRIGEEGELKLMKEEAMEELLEESYRSGSEAFLHFSSAYAPEKDDRNIEEIINRTYNFTRAFPNAAGWFDNHIGSGKEKEPDLKPVLSQFNKEVRDLLEEEGSVLLQTLQYARQEGIAKCKSSVLAERLLEIIDYIVSAESFDETGSRLNESLQSYPDKRGMCKTDKMRLDYTLITTAHDRIKDYLKTWTGTSFCMTTEAIREEIREQMPHLEELSRLVLRFDEIYASKKSKKNVFDFDDLEHFALRLLTDGYDDAGIPIPSQTAKELSEKYKAIYIDEYQDVNLIQETIVNLLHQPGMNDLFTVGDVKQSIYRFRQARPDLFLDRSRRYLQADPADKNPDYSEAEGVEIRLLANFRSLPCVIDTVNYFFRQLMDRDFGGVDYDDKTALKCGSLLTESETDEASDKNFEDKNSDKDGPFSEMLLFMRDDEYGNLADPPDKLLAETAVIADRIEELRKEGFSYGDMVILLRSVNGRAETMADFLEDHGIPAVSQSQTGYFETREIRIIMNYLAVVDNVYQDIPMASVMMSTIGGFTEDDMARLRILRGDGEGVGFSLYDLMTMYLEKNSSLSGEGEEDPGDPLSRKIEHFLSLLHKFRAQKKEAPLPDLLWDIYTKTGFYYDVQLLKDGETRRQNLLMLLKKARDYEQTVFKGLFYFHRYMKQLRTYEVKMDNSFPGDRAKDRVRIMSVHKSKGLEFPVVFVSNLSGKMNMQDLSKETVFHPELGIGLEYRDIKKRIRYKSFMQNVISDRLKKEFLEEELRLLYVAFTRAQSKLILTGTLKEKDIEKVDSLLLNKANRLKVTNYMDWLLPAMAANPSMISCLKSRGGDRPPCPADETISREAAALKVKMYHWNDVAHLFSVTENEESKSRYENLLSALSEALRGVEADDIKAVENSFSYIYPYREETEWKRKYSVSELKRLSYLPDPENRENVTGLFDKEGELPFETPDPSDAEIPLLEEENEKLTPALRGTLYHKVMELLPFGNIEDREQLDRELSSIMENYPQTKALDTEDVADAAEAFLFSEEGKMLAGYDREGLVCKEKPFTIGLPANAIYPGTESEEPVIVQGIIDLYCKTPEGLRLFDYKTDRIKAGEESLLLDRYRTQMIYYKTALEQITGEKVVKADLYSFALKKFIPVPL